MSKILNLSVFILIFFALVSISKVSNASDAVTNDTDFTFLITGGYRPPQHTLTKYIVSIRNHLYAHYFGDNHFCGGSIIAPRVILTAAHCLMRYISQEVNDDEADFEYLPIEPELIVVVAKAPNRLKLTDDTLVLEVEKVRVHPDYVPILPRPHDIGILKLRSDITLDGYLAKVIPLPSSAFPPGTHCTVVGWGRLLNHGPLAADAVYVDVNINSVEECTHFDLYIEGQICASDLEDPELDACQGDSGSPLICNSELAGLVSYGEGCASGHPGVYTNVSFYRNWIAENNCGSHVSLRYLTVFCIILAINI